MPVLNRKKNKTDYRLVGVYLPPLVYNKITLSTLAHGISKSSLFKTLIEAYLVQIQKKETEENLLEILVMRINKQWSDRKKEHPRASFNEFLNKVNKELIEKGLNTEQMAVIMLQINNNGKNKKNRATKCSNEKKS